MSLVTDILDRLSGVAVLKEKLAQQEKAWKACSASC